MIDKIEACVQLGQSAETCNTTEPVCLTGSFVWNERRPCYACWLLMETYEWHYIIIGTTKSHPRKTLSSTPQLARTMYETACAREKVKWFAIQLFKQQTTCPWFYTPRKAETPTYTPFNYFHFAIGGFFWYNLSQEGFFIIKSLPSISIQHFGLVASKRYLAC